MKSNKKNNQTISAPLSADTLEENSSNLKAEQNSTAVAPKSNKNKQNNKLKNSINKNQGPQKNKQRSYIA